MLEHQTRDLTVDGMFKFVITLNYFFIYIPHPLIYSSHFHTHIYLPAYVNVYFYHSQSGKMLYLKAVNTCRYMYVKRHRILY